MQQKSIYYISTELYNTSYFAIIFYAIDCATKLSTIDILTHKNTINFTWKLAHTGRLLTL